MNELQRNAIAEARRKELESYQRALDIQWLNSRMEDGRMGRSLALIEREAEMEKNFQERTDHAAIVNARAEKETKLGMEIAKVRSEEVCQLMRLHYLRERDPELRQLQRKLQAGYVCKDLKQQILHNEYKRLQDKVEESQANRVLLNALYNDAEAAEQEERAKMEQGIRYTKELQQQLVDRQRQKQCQYEDTLIEKKMQEGIVRTMADEDQREIQQKRESMERMRKEMVTFKQARLAWKQKQKEMVVREEREIEEQCRAASDRSAAIVAERERKLLMREEQTKKIGQKILDDEAKRQHREGIIKSLQEQEYLERNWQEDQAERDKASRARDEAQRDAAAQRAARDRAARDRARREAQLRAETEKKMALDEEKEREKERRRKEKNRQYMAELQRQIADNARRREREKALEEGRARAQFDADKAWCAEVSEERTKLIEEHAPRLIGYLQAGVVAPRDLEALRRGVAAQQAPLDVDALARTARPKRFSKCNEQCRVLREY